MSRSPDSGYAAILEKARAELASAKAEALKLESQIARLQRTVLALSSLVEQPIIDPAKGLTEGIKAILQSVSPSGLFPATIRLKLEEAGFDFRKSTNPLASIHAILKRLVERKQAYASKNHEGKTAYFWHVTRMHMAEEFLATFSPDNIFPPRSFAPVLQPQQPELPVTKNAKPRKKGER